MGSIGSAISWARAPPPKASAPSTRGVETRVRMRMGSPGGGTLQPTWIRHPTFPAGVGCMGLGHRGDSLSPDFEAAPVTGAAPRLVGEPPRPDRIETGRR